MKIIHTSDWHLGNRLYNYDRTDEEEELFRQLAGVVAAERRADAHVLHGRKDFQLIVFSRFIDGAERIFQLFQYLFRVGKNLVTDSHFSLYIQHIAYLL